ncbi:uncharacterized protein METZ01_LOCUS302695 [marine metagenome]|uniref:Uncharacterized protein n=1 Tax=marine metagenome TaxID=408172 RepID=A0A382MR68_9ZZZZ
MNTLHKRSPLYTRKIPRSTSNYARPRREHSGAVVNSLKPLPRAMAERTWENTYELTDEKLEQLEEAESLMERMDLSGAERVLLAMLEDEPECIPVLSNLGHLYGKHLSEFENAVEYYDRVLEIEPDNAWARDARRRYSRYIGRD